MQIFHQRASKGFLVFLLPTALAGAAAPAPPPAAGFELRLPAGIRASLAARPARDLALAAFVAADQPPAVRQEAAAGAVRLALPAAGSWELTVAAPQFLPAAAVLAGAVEATRLPALELQPLSPASLVLTSGGRPAAGLEVLALPTADLYPAPWRPAVGRSRSDAGGRAVLPGGQPCEVMVAGQAGPLWRGLLTVAPGAAQTLELAPPHAFVVEVAAADGRPAAGVRVAADGLLLAATTSAAGRLEIAAAAPPALRALAADGGWASQPAASPVAAPAAGAPAATAPGVLRLQLAPPQRLPIRVFDRDSRQPIAGALLWPGAHPEILARSAGGGEAELVVPWGGASLVNAAAPAYRPLVADASQAARLLLQPAPPELVMAGRVEDTAGQAVAGATVKLRPSAERLRVTSAREDQRPAAKTDARGEFRIAAESVAEVDLEVTAAGFAPALVRGVALPPPRVAAAGAPPAADLGTVVLERGTTLAGRVITPEGAPLAGATVAAREPRGRDLQQATVGDDGAFRFGDFAAGTEIELRAEHPDTQSATLLVRAGDGEDLQLVLEPASRVAGRVTLDGEGADGVLVLLRSAGTTRATTKTGEDGRFDLKGVKPGALELQTVRRGLFSKTLSFDLAAGESIEDLAVELYAGAVVEGKVRDPEGQPLDRVIVELAGASGDLRSLLAASRAYSGADGSYRIEGLPPGQVTLRARRIDLLTAEQQVEIADGHQEVDWRLGAGTEVAGVIVDDQRQPVAGARIAAFDGENRAIGDGVESDLAGRFRILGVPPGTLRVVGKSDRQPTAEAVATLIAGAEPPLVQLVCPPAAGVAGRLLGASFEDLARAQVWAISEKDQQISGLVAYDGSYRIDRLQAGEWRVYARAPGFPREAAGRLTLRQGERGALDLELSRDGYRLSGVVLRGGAPLAGVAVVAGGAALGSGSGARTDGAGAFAIESLPAGAYQVTLLGDGVNETRPLELQGNLDLTFELDAAAPPPDPAAAIPTQRSEEHP